jgi:hypothetical protein
MKRSLLLVLLLATPLFADTTVDCAHEVFASVAQDVWPGWTDAPFSLLLIDGDNEVLVTPPASAPPPFVSRKRTFDPKLLATFPAVSGEPTIVVGTPAATGKSDTAWLVTLLHEHFHQLQYSRPGYYDAANALGLARGDTTGMWMLNYDFPYADAAVQQKYDALSHALAAALRARETAGFAAALRNAKSAWRELRESLKPDDYTYFSFQAWQEGVARYVELQSATKAAAHPPACLTALQPPIASVAKQTFDEIMATLDAPQLGRRKRVAFYAAGAAIALLLDETSPSWKREYFKQPFRLDAYFAP